MHLLRLCSWHKKESTGNSALHSTESWIKTTEHEYTTLAEIEKRCRVEHFEEGFEERVWNSIRSEAIAYKHHLVFDPFFWPPTVFQKEKKSRKMWDLHVAQLVEFSSMSLLNTCWCICLYSFSEIYFKNTFCIYPKCILWHFLVSWGTYHLYFSFKPNFCFQF